MSPECEKISRCSCGQRNATNMSMFNLNRGRKKNAPDHLINVDALHRQTIKAKCYTIMKKDIGLLVTITITIHFIFI